MLVLKSFRNDPPHLIVFGKSNTNELKVNDVETEESKHEKNQVIDEKTEGQSDIVQDFTKILENTDIQNLLMNLQQASSELVSFNNLEELTALANQIVEKAQPQLLQPIEQKQQNLELPNQTTIKTKVRSQRRVILNQHGVTIKRES